MSEKTLMQKYLNSIQTHGDNNNPVNELDTMLRLLIGKTDGVEVGKASHNAIIQREMDVLGKDPETYCRCCGINLDRIYGRCNDYLIFRNRKCRGPICIDCIKDRPDVWYQKYKEAVDAWTMMKGF